MSSKNLKLKGLGNTFVKLLFFLPLLLLCLYLFKIFDVQAETVTTAVTVGNSAPAFTVNPFEDPASATTTPTNVGSDVTWKATAEDGNGDNYYLIVCSTDSVTPGTSGPPTCGATTWCTSTATTSASQATCSRTALAGDPYSNAWFGFVCDGLPSGSACSTTSQGTGDSGSPFIVNHAPGFTAVSNDSPRDPGQTVTWSTTSSDADGDTVKLLVCKTAGITAGACTGDSWCSSAFVASNPTCGYNIPSVNPSGSNNAYVYIIDAFNFPATSAQQGSNVSFSVNNVAPTVSAVTINGGLAITLLESTTQAVTLTATVSDNNSCEDLSSVLGYVYRSGITYTGCDTSGEANNNNCYPEVSCTVVGGTCTGPTDASANYTCSVNLQYYADPTDATTQYPDDTWKNTIKATDGGALTHNLEVTTGVEVNSLAAFDITGSINFGSLGVDQKNDPLDKIVTTTATGNVGLDQEHSGSNMCVDHPTCSGGTPIAVANQKYALATLTAYASGTALSATPVEVLINVLKATSSTPSTKSIWWGILIPVGTDAGSYTGANTVTGYKSNPLNW